MKEKPNKINEQYERNVQRFSDAVSSDSTIMITVCPSLLDV